MISILFTHVAEKQWGKLEKKVQEQMREKLNSIKSSPSPESFLKSLSNLLPATHRLRVGTYRLLLQCTKNQWIVLRVGHRRDIYK